MDIDGNGALSYNEFLQFFAKGSQQDRNVVAEVSGISVEQAIAMIQDKIRSRLASGGAELRRTFQFFDRDGDGRISIDEFATTLEYYGGLKFEQQLLPYIHRWSSKGRLWAKCMRAWECPLKN